MPGGQLPLVAAGLVATLLPPPLVQADMAEPRTMVAQMPIAAGTLVMMLALLFCGNHVLPNRLLRRRGSSLASSQPRRIAFL
jgi:hypothetical protein